MDLKKYVKNRLPHKRFVPGKTKIPLQEVMFSEDEITESIESLLSTYLVMGKKVNQFERSWSKWLGCKYSIATNSGTSALLLVMIWLKFHKASEEKKEVLIPAVTWSTTLTTPLILGLRPVLVDVNMKNLCTNSFSQYITKNTLAVVPVHLMGHSCNMSNIMSEANASSVYVVEDACEAHGTRWNGQKVGTFGDVGCFSFMFSHHISTIEGGMICVNSDDLNDVFRTFRAHGWIREISKDKKRYFEEHYNYIDRRFLFSDVGLNVRPTEIVGAFGIHQITKIDSFIEKRRYAFNKISQELRKYLGFIYIFEEQENEYYSPFAYPVVVKEDAPFSKQDLTHFLEENMIETRQIEGGNLARQPLYEKYKGCIEMRGNLRNADLIQNNGFFFGINQNTDDNKIGYIVDVLERFFKRF